jgi:toxin ParE1/3/4
VRLLIHEEARAEAVDGADYYESQQLGLGTRFTDVVASHLLKIELSPERYAKLETTRMTGNIRRSLLPKFPYLIMNEIHEDLIHVLAIAHASRRPNYWMARRNPSA